MKSKTWLEIEGKIKEIAEKDVSSCSKADLAFLSECFSDISGVRYFTRYARDLSWLIWVDSQGYIEKIFSKQTQFMDVENFWAIWISDVYLEKYPNELSEIIQNHKFELNGGLWWQLARVLIYDCQLLGKDYFSWVKLIFRTYQPNYSRDFLSFFLKAEQTISNKEILLFVIDNLTKPFPGQGKTGGYTVKIDFLGEVYWLRDIWKKVIVGSFEIYSELFPIFEKHLAEASEILKGDDGLFYYFRRPAIEAHEQNEVGYDDVLNALIDFVRDYALSTVITNKTKGLDLIYKWSDSEYEIFNRLAIFCLSKQPNLLPDEKLEIVIDKGWLYRTELRHEIFNLIADNFNAAGDKTKNRFLDYTIANIPKERYEGDLADYQAFNVLDWLSTNSNFPRIEMEIAKIREAHPTFRSRENPDFTSYYSSGWVPPAESPIKISLLLDRNPNESSLAKYVLEYENKQEQWHSPKAGILNSIKDASSENPSWGLALLSSLIRHPLFQPSYADSIIDGWITGTLLESDWKGILQFIQSEEKLLEERTLKEIRYPLSRLFEVGIREQARQIPSSLLDEAVITTVLIWDKLVPVDTDRTIVSDIDWLSIAINQAGGRIAEFWIHALLRKLRELEKEGEPINFIPEEFKIIIQEKILQGNSLTEASGRAVFAGELPRWFSLDKDFAIKNLVPLLSWSANRDVAAQVWHGYLYTRRLWPTLIEELYPFYQETFPIISELPQELQKAFCGHIAIYTYYSDSYNETNLFAFLQAVNEQFRAYWAASIGDALQSAKDNKQIKPWDDWIKAYWDKRLTDEPISLQPDDEMQTMIEWSIPLQDRFPEVVDRIVMSPVPDFKHSHFFYSLKEAGLPKNKPADVLKLIYHFLSHIQHIEGWKLHEEYVSIFKEIMSEPENQKNYKGQLLAICEELSRLGYEKAYENSQVLNQL